MSFLALSEHGDVLNPNYKGHLLDGTVVDDKDPLGIDRIRVTIPKLYTGPVDTLPWAAPIKPNMATGSGPTAGIHGAPAIGSSVVILLQNGDPHYPMYLGGLKKVADPNFPAGRAWGFTDNYGNVVVFSDTKQIRIDAAAGVSIVISPQGDVSVGAQGNVSVAAGGNVNVSAGSDMRLEAAGDIEVLAGGDLHLHGTRIFHKKA